MSHQPPRQSSWSKRLSPISIKWSMNTTSRPWWMRQCRKRVFVSANGTLITSQAYKRFSNNFKRRLKMKTRSNKSGPNLRTLPIKKCSLIWTLKSIWQTKRSLWRLQPKTSMESPSIRTISNIPSRARIITSNKMQLLLLLLMRYLLLTMPPWLRQSPPSKKLLSQSKMRIKQQKK